MSNHIQLGVVSKNLAYVIIIDFLSHGNRIKGFLNIPFSYTIHKISQASKRQKLSTVHLPHQASTMAESSSIQEHTAQSSLIMIKPNQNLIIDFIPFKYDSFMLQIVECLKYSPLVHALSKVECVPMSVLSQVYSSANYIKVEECITLTYLIRKLPSPKLGFALF